MLYFVVLHLPENRPAARILLRQALEMVVQMRFDLFFRLGDKPEADPIAKRARHGADRIGSCIPQGIQHAGMAAKLGQAALAPGKMIGLLGGGLLHRRGDFRVSRRQGLALIQGLCGYLTGVVDPHQPCGPCRLLRAQPGHIARGHGRLPRTFRGRS